MQKTMPMHTIEHDTVLKGGKHIGIKHSTIEKRDAIQSTLMMVLPTCSSSFPSSISPNKLSAGACVILILQQES
jgi:hypothetical protein